MEKIIDGEKLNVPTHIAVIMDGNGRWAKKQEPMPLSRHVKMRIILVLNTLLYMHFQLKTGKDL